MVSFSFDGFTYFQELKYPRDFSRGLIKDYYKHSYPLAKKKLKCVNLFPGSDLWKFKISFVNIIFYEIQF